MPRRPRAIAADYVYHVFRNAIESASSAQMEKVVMRGTIVTKMNVPEPKALRNHSYKMISAMEVSLPPSHLPLTDVPAAIRPLQEIVIRICVLHGILSASFGLKISQCQRWLEENNLNDDLTFDERKVFTESRLLNEFRFNVEALWALAWTVRLIDVLDWKQPCGPQLVKVLPDLKKNEPIWPMMAQCQLRDKLPLVQAEDMAYCLHWLVRQANIEEHDSHLLIKDYVVIQRRKALDWILNPHISWDDVPLDT